MAKIFASQSTLNSSRNRANRTLERQIDNIKVEEVVKPICEYNSYCNVKKVIGRETCYLEHTKSCRTYKFYEMYK